MRTRWLYNSASGRTLSQMSIVTKRGDEGETDLLFGKRISKVSTRIEANGSVDELNSVLGMVRAANPHKRCLEIIEEIQSKLISLMGEIATLPEDQKIYDEKAYGRVSSEDVSEIEKLVKSFEKDFNLRFKGWAIPGKDSTLSAAYLDLARATCRRAERRVYALEREGGMTSLEPRLYLNRLSDLLWILARGEALSLLSE